MDEVRIAFKTLHKLRVRKTFIRMPMEEILAEMERKRAENSIDGNEK